MDILGRMDDDARGQVKGLKRGKVHRFPQHSHSFALGADHA